MCTGNVVSNVRRIGIDALDRLALLGNHVRQLGKDGPQLRDSRFYRLDCCAAGLDVVLLLTQVLAMFALEIGEGEGVGWKNEEITTNLVIHVLKLLHSAHCSVCMPFFSSDHIQRQQVSISYPAFTLILKVVPRVVVVRLLEEERGCKGLDLVAKESGWRTHNSVEGLWRLMQ